MTKKDTMDKRMAEEKSGECCQLEMHFSAGELCISEMRPFHYLEQFREVTTETECEMAVKGLRQPSEFVLDIMKNHKIGEEENQDEYESGNKEVLNEARMDMQSTFKALFDKTNVQGK